MIFSENRFILSRIMRAAARNRETPVCDEKGPRSRRAL
jgi:hypothetical protein